MKFLTETIIILSALGLTVGNIVHAQDQPQQKTATISGSTQVPFVEMMGLPGNPVSGSDGRYSATVPTGWSGKVVATKEGYNFEPAFIQYANLIDNMDTQDYKPSLVRFTISGSAGVHGVVMKGLPNNPVTDGTGHYDVTVDYGWNGRVEPVKEGYDFEPPGLIYEKVVRNLTNQNYAALQHGRQVAHPTSESRGDVSWRFERGRWEPAQPGTSSPASARRGRSTGYQPTIRSGGRKVLVIPAGEVKAKELAETVEDMHVMAHILDERFKETRRIQGLFTDFGAFFRRESCNTEATYLQGFGVLFLMEVNFAFSPPPKTEAKEAEEPTEAVDSTWQKARKEVFSPGASAGAGLDNSTDDYDEQMVEELKQELIEALKHASNIRNVAPDEWVILTVIGGQKQVSMGFGGGMGMGGSMSRYAPTGTGGSSGGGGAMGGGMGGYGGGGTGFVVGGYGGGGGMMGAGGMGGMYGGVATYGEATFSSSTVLTIRAKKSHVDDFATGQLNLGQFQENVQIFMY